MKNLVNRLLDNRLGLMESLGKHGLKVERAYAKKRVKDLNEGIVPDFDKDSEEEYIKKLNEAPEDERDMFPPPRDKEEEVEDKDEDMPGPDDDDKIKDDDLDKEYLGKKDETYFYLVKDEEDGESGGLKVVDQEGKIIFTGEDSEVDSSDIFHFIVAAVREIKPDDVSYDVFLKYVVPKIEELEKEQGEFIDEEPEEGEMADSEESDMDQRPRESKNSLHEIRITFDRREFDVKLVDEGAAETVVEINGKRFSFSPSFSDMYKDDSGNITEDKLEELALGALSEMDKIEFDDLVVKGPQHSKHKEMPRESIKKVIKESEDLSKDVKELQKSAETSIKDGNFIEAAELCQRLATVQQAVGSVGGEEEMAAEDYTDEDMVEEEDDDEVKAEVEAMAAEEDDYDDDATKEGKVPGAKDDEAKVIDKLEEKKPMPTCSKCNGKHYPFHKCKTEGDTKEDDDTKDDDDTKEEKNADEACGKKHGMSDQLKSTEGPGPEDVRKKKTKEGIVPDFDKDSEEEYIKKLNEMCDKCEEDPCICEKEEENRKSKKQKEEF